MELWQQCRRRLHRYLKEWERRIRWRLIRTNGCMRQSKRGARWSVMLRSCAMRSRYHPAYYHFGVEATNYFDLGPQNSRGFRALKVWLALQQVGQEGYAQMISDDMRLSRAMFESVSKHPELEAMTQGLSIATFRYVPAGLDGANESVAKYLNELNQELLTRLQQGGDAYLSNAVIDGKYALRACIVNFRTTRGGCGGL